MFSKIQKLDVLLSLYVGFIVISELMGAKTFPFSLGPLHLNATVAIFVLPFVYAINDIITELYGKSRAQSVVRSSLLVVAVLIGFSVLATSLPPSHRFATQEPAYDAVFGVSIRIALSSLAAFALSEFTDVLVFAKLRQKFGNRNLWLRTNVSNFLSEFLDTAVFMTLAFYALHTSFGANVGFLASIAIPYWLLRCALSVLETPLVYAGVRWLKGTEGASQ